MNLDLQKIASAVNGKLHPHHAHGEICGIATDSRLLTPGELFVALRGPTFDGHDFIAAAAARGAGAILCDHLRAEQSLPQIVVADTLRALGDLAAFWRHRFHLPVAAITGSSGKTTTKEMLAAILARTAPGLKTAGNFNNLIGLPLTLFQLSTAAQWAVLEMGMSERGEIARLTEIAAPNVGVITNVAPAHLLTMKSLGAIARAKGELFAALQPGALAVINLDDERVAAIPVANGVQRRTYGLTAAAEIRAAEIRPEGAEVRFVLHAAGEARPLRLPVPGRHNVSNALAAATAALGMGRTLDDIVAGLETFAPAKGRMETTLLSDGIVLVEDTYNANPLSVKAALIALDEMGGSGERLVVLGDMLELGESSAELHREVGEFAAAHCDHLFLLGQESRAIAVGARSAGLAAARITSCASHDEATQALMQSARPGARILIKGSRGMKMEKITAELRSRLGLAPTKGR
jgi:UDP-N-acetylmuramoyl-tripeptide--D-alanyl-D-alanine ligase